MFASGPPALLATGSYLEADALNASFVILVELEPERGVASFFESAARMAVRMRRFNMRSDYLCPSPGDAMPPRIFGTFSYASSAHPGPKPLLSRASAPGVYSAVLHL